MQFLREDQGAAVQAIAQRMCDALFDGKRVLWLVSGGSNIAAQAAVMRLLADHCGGRLDGLAIMPMDERYGPDGHPDSNVQQLLDAGFKAGSATLVDVLMHNVPLDQTVRFYNDVAATALANADVIVGQFGLGADGHVAGILPGSAAASADEGTVAGYNWNDYTRMTLTPKTLTQITDGFVLAYGSSKKVALKRLQKHTEDLSELPAVLLYELPNVSVYNDQLESKESTK